MTLTIYGSPRSPSTRVVDCELEFGKPIEIFRGRLTLVSATPQRGDSQPNPSAYRFRFTFTR